jgi:hypothetical protein
MKKLVKDNDDYLKANVELELRVEKLENDYQSLKKNHDNIITENVSLKEKVSFLEKNNEMDNNNNNNVDIKQEIDLGEFGENNELTSNTIGKNDYLSASILQQRNAQVLPHLRDSYFLSTTLDHDISEQDIKVLFQSFES